MSTMLHKKLLLYNKINDILCGGFMNRLRDLREDNDLKQADIADVLNISQQYYQCYESGKNELPTRHLITLAKFYKISADYILGLTDTPRPIESSNYASADAKTGSIVKKIESADAKIKKAIYALLEIN